MPELIPELEPGRRQRTCLESLQENTARLGLNTASETGRGQFNDRDYITKVIYFDFDQDSDSGDSKDMAY